MSEQVISADEAHGLLELLDAHLEWHRSAADPAPGPLIYSLISKVMADVGSVSKDRTNEQQKYQFRGIDDFYNACQPALVKHGVFVATRVIEQKREERQSKSGGTLLWVILTVEHCFHAPDGSYVTVTTIGEAMDSGDKASNKAMSAAMKYALVQTLCIPTCDPEADTETQNHEVNGDAPARQPATAQPGPRPPVSKPKRDEEFPLF